MSTRLFLNGADGTEITIPDDSGRGFEQSCTMCGKILVRQEPDGTGTVNESRYVGTLQVAGALLPDPGAPDTEHGHLVQKQIPFELCLEDAAKTLGQIDPTLPGTGTQTAEKPPRAADDETPADVQPADWAPDVDEPAADVDEHEPAAVGSPR
jgi:hypothetical protein